MLDCKLIPSYILNEICKIHKQTIVNINEILNRSITLLKLSNLSSLILKLLFINKKEKNNNKDKLVFVKGFKDNLSSMTPRNKREKIIKKK